MSREIIVAQGVKKVTSKGVAEFYGYSDGTAEVYVTAEGAGWGHCWSVDPSSDIVQHLREIAKTATTFEDFEKALSSRKDTFRNEKLDY